MAMARICDVCGELVGPPHKQIKILDAPDEDMLPRDYKTIKSLDMHNKCYAGFVEWLNRTQSETKGLKAVVQ